MFDLVRDLDPAGTEQAVFQQTIALIDGVLTAKKDKQAAAVAAAEAPVAAPVAAAAVPALDIKAPTPVSGTPRDPAAAAAASETDASAAAASTDPAADSAAASSSAKTPRTLAVVAEPAPVAVETEAAALAWMRGDGLMERTVSQVCARVGVGEKGRDGDEGAIIYKGQSQSQMRQSQSPQK